MKSGVHQVQLSKSCLSADEVVWYQSDNMGLDFELLTSSLGYQVVFLIRWTKLSLSSQIPAAREIM